MLKMKCGVCGNFLIENGTYDADNVEYLYTNLNCCKCGADVSVIFHENSLNVVCDDCEHRTDECLCDIRKDCDKECMHYSESCERYDCMERICNGCEVGG